MKILTWIKSLSWLAILGTIGAAIAMVLNARRAGKMEANVARDEQKVKNLQHGTRADIEAAKQLQDAISLKKIQAREVRKKSAKSLERLGQDETMADIAKRFNGKRVRHRSDPSAGL